jgi:hypothetical protein
MSKPNDFRVRLTGWNGATRNWEISALPLRGANVHRLVADDKEVPSESWQEDLANSDHPKLTWLAAGDPPVGIEAVLQIQDSWMQRLLTSTIAVPLIGALGLIGSAAFASWGNIKNTKLAACTDNSLKLESDLTMIYNDAKKYGCTNVGSPSDGVRACLKDYNNKKSQMKIILDNLSEHQ